MSSKTGPQIKRKSVPLIGKSAESFQIGPLSPSLSDSLTNGTSIPPPDPPTPPPKEENMHAATPPQQQPPLTDAAYNQFVTSAASPPVPGAFPDDDFSPPNAPQSHTSSKLQKMGYEASASASASPSPYPPSFQPSASSEPARRPSSVFRLLPFKRGFNDRASSSADSFSSRRPQTPGAESMVGSLADSGGEASLGRKKSGSFWGRRKSSLSFVAGAEEVGMRNGHNPGSVHQRTVSNTGDGGEAADDGEEEFPPRLKKKKSLTFWRRTSSLGLDKMGSGYGQQQPVRNGSASSGANGYHEDEEDTVMGEPDPITLRPRTPPPQLPDIGHVVQDKGGLMGEEDWFGSIH